VEDNSPAMKGARSVIVCGENQIAGKSGEKKKGHHPLIPQRKGISLKKKRVTLSSKKGRRELRSASL